MKNYDISTEEKIFRIASNTFLLYGYHGTKLRQIANQAGVNSSVIHYYFRSKEKLYQQVIGEAINFVISEKPDIHLDSKSLEQIIWFLYTELHNNRETFESAVKYLYPDDWDLALAKVSQWIEIREILH